MKDYVIVDRSGTIGKYFNEVNKGSLLTVEKEVEIATRIVNGDEKAVNELVTSNLKFVISVAKDYQGLGVPLSDLINEGNIGLIKAANRFDPSRGFRFISYAVYWIKRSIMQSLNDNSRMIRLPTNIISKISKLNKENKGEGYESDLTYPTCISLNTKIGTYSGFELGDLISDESADPITLLGDESKHLTKILNKTLDCLNNRERGIIECYYGLNTKCEPMTLEAIGDRYDLTKERIRQIKVTALRRLRCNNLELHNLINN